MGIAVNLVTYLIGTMHMPSAASANVVTDFMGTSFLLCLLGGFLADSFLGRFKTIAIFSVIQAIGTAALAVATKLPQLRPPPCHGNGSSCVQANGFQMGILYMALYLISLGTGGLKSSVSGKKYRYKKSMGSPIVQILQVIAASISKRKLDLPYDPSLLYENNPDGSRIHHTNQFHCIGCYRLLDKAAVAVEADFKNGSEPNPWKLCTVTRVEEVKMMVRLLPIWATTIIFWTTYAQMITFSVEQASTMYRNVGSFQIPAGSLTVFFVAAILLTLAVYDRFIMPFWKKWKDKQTGFSSLQRIAIGLALSTMGMAVAALVEKKRLSVAVKLGSTATTTIVPLSVFLLIPQFLLVGSGEAFIYTGQLDFFITQSPKGMKTMSTGLFLTTLSLGFFVSSFLVMVVKKVTTTNTHQGWLADNINHGRLDCFYWLLALLGVVNFVVFLVCATWYKPKQEDHHGSGLDIEITNAKNIGDVDKC
ncbi:Protein NRT1/ PTR FAMILY 6.2 [Linum perenne]